METKLWNRNFILACIGNFLMFFSFYLLVPILPIYLDEVFSASKSAIGAILSLYALTALLIRPFSGFIVDSFSRKTVLVICYFGFFAFFAGYIAAGTLLLFTIVRSLHGFTFGAVSVASTTMAIDVMPAAKRGSGIAYYGVANNLAMCIGPMSTMYLHQHNTSYDMIFLIALLACGLGFVAVSFINAPQKEQQKNKLPLSLDRFWLKKAWLESFNLIFISFSYGLLTTYLAIYGKEELGIESGSGTFFLLFAVGIIISRLAASHWINRGYVAMNITVGTIILTIGYSIFTICTSPAGYYSSALIIGLGQGMFLPACQTIFINLAPNS
ncbi:MAG: MFS transporter, partial [Muribaculaceae bacterium]|nr:MFS transporter [Muribaculaceae bacterium]